MLVCSAGKRKKNVKKLQNNFVPIKLRNTGSEMNGNTAFKITLKGGKNSSIHVFSRNTFMKLNKSCKKMKKYF